MCAVAAAVGGRRANRDDPPVDHEGMVADVDGRRDRAPGPCVLSRAGVEPVVTTARREPEHHEGADHSGGAS
jgi:hypothetical protein